MMLFSQLFRVKFKFQILGPESVVFLLPDMRYTILATGLVAHTIQATVRLLHDQPVTPKNRSQNWSKPRPTKNKVSPKYEN